MNLLCRLGYHRDTTQNQFVVFDDLVWQTVEYCPRCKKIVHSVRNDVFMPIINKDTIIRIVGDNSEEVKDIFAKQVGDLILHRNIIPLRLRHR